MRQNVSLAELTTFQIGGPARYFVAARSEPELLDAVRWARRSAQPLLVLGGGSNLLVHDGGFSGLVLQIAITGPIEESDVDGAAELVVPAGTPWETLVDRVGERDLSGIECLAGIPGLTGGTPVQNVGAYGQEVADTIQSVRALDLRTDQAVDLPRDDCGFAYRRSIFNGSERGRYIITAVTFRFDRSARPKLNYADLRNRFGTTAPRPDEVSRAIREIRRAKGMLLVEGDPDCRSAGSFFKNPVVEPEAFDRIARMPGLNEGEVPHWPQADGRVKLAAAWLLEQAGFPKGFAMGRAGISSRHNLALVNRGGARCEEVLVLRDRIRGDVARRFAVFLEQEPVEVGLRDGAASSESVPGLSPAEML